MGYYCLLAKRRPCTHHHQFLWNSGLGKWLNQQTRRNGGCGQIPNKMENCSYHQQLPTWDLGLDSRRGFYSKNLEIVVWKVRHLAPGRTVCPEQNHLPVQADLLVRESQIAIQMQTVELILRQTHQQPPETIPEKLINTNYSKGFSGHHTCISPCSWMPSDKKIISKRKESIVLWPSFGGKGKKRGLIMQNTSLVLIRKLQIVCLRVTFLG